MTLHTPALHLQPFALYNEIEPYAADWLENLIQADLIAKGIVDRRSIEDLRGDDLRGFRQVHFFAGIGVWSYALRRAGVADDVAVWTGSCPCQPFSAAGKGGGMDDERHLWPALLHLIRERRPVRFLGEQVASKDGLGWLDLVSTDLEAEGYAIGSLDTCSAGSGAPHIRQRLRIYAYDLRSAAGDGSRGVLHPPRDGWFERWAQPSGRSLAGRCGTGGMADHEVFGRRERLGRVLAAAGSGKREVAGQGYGYAVGADSATGRLDHHHHQGLEGFGSGHPSEGRRDGALRPTAEAGEFGGLGDARRDGDRQHAGILPGDEGEHDLWPEDRDHASFDSESTGGVADDCGSRGQQQCSQQRSDTPQPEQQSSCGNDIGGRDDVDWVADTVRGGTRHGSGEGVGTEAASDHEDRCLPRERLRPRFESTSDDARRPGPTNGFWRDADWLFCRDGKWRPVVASYVEMVDGSPPAVGHGSTLAEDRQGHEARLRALLDTFGQEAVSERAGGSWSLQEEEVLRPHLHGELDGRPDEGRGCEEQPSAVGEDGSDGMRDLREERHSLVGASSGREPDEQRSVELADIVRLLPQSLSLAELWGRRRDADQLRLLLRLIAEERPLLHPSVSPEASWASLGQDAKDRIGLAFDARAWRRVVSFPLVDGSEFRLGSGHPAFEGKSRTGMLKAYGNAVDAEATTDFIEVCRASGGDLAARSVIDIEGLLV